MSTTLSLTTQQQNELLGAFLRAREDAKKSVTAYAYAYRDCIAAEIDMGRYVDTALGKKLLLIAGRETVLSEPELLFLPASAVAALTSLPRDTQAKVMAEGVQVWRDGKVATVRFHDLSSKEVKLAIDATGGTGRIVPPTEQAVRDEPQPPKHDHILSLRLTYPRFKELVALAHKKGKSPEGLIIDLLKQEGVF